jgi:hypothetical protein
MNAIPRHADATLAARIAPIQAAPEAERIAHARALLRACPVPAASLRMWHAAMPTARDRWGWAPLLDALITAAEANEAAGHTARLGPR